MHITRINSAQYAHTLGIISVEFVNSIEIFWAHLGIFSRHMIGPIMGLILGIFLRIIGIFWAYYKPVFCLSHAHFWAYHGHVFCILRAYFGHIMGEFS